MPLNVGDSLVGIGCSYGQAVGRALVVSTQNLPASIQDGEILVVEYIGPDLWLLMAVAGAVVSERGGIMSHGAVIARELALPAIVSVKDCTKVIKSGQRIAVNGDKGIVQILSA